ncbi:MAG: carbamoyl-phosphate synthase large subunit [Bacillota bacterium]
MPRRTDLRKILLIGSGPIIIGQACEFDYSGTQACRALREEGYQVVLMNSNPATIMTDPDLADRTYIEPLTATAAAAVIELERPQALLPTVGGQTALNLAVQLAESGVLERFGVELIGADSDVIKQAEDRALFKAAMARAGLAVAESLHLDSVPEALRFAEKTGYPVIVRPSFTLGGSGGGIATSGEELAEMIAAGIALSPIGKVLVEESLIGWQEFELEVMRDCNDNTVVICSIENIDPMGVHTGESITVAPIQTLTDREYQTMRDAAFRALREIGVETGGCNIQFALDPSSGRLVVVEMNPRVSRSSALASKATGFPIAKIAAKLAVGYTLDELPNDITRKTPASFEPALDYCVVKIPRWDFAKFPGADRTLTTTMKSVGEVMGIGRTFKEALQKALRSLEEGFYGLEEGVGLERPATREELERLLAVPRPERVFHIADAFRSGFETEAVIKLTGINGWFLEQIKQIVEMEKELANGDVALLEKAKAWGFSDRRLAALAGVAEEELRCRLAAGGIRPAYRRVDTCAGEFEAVTPYFYSTYEGGDETALPGSGQRKVIILGSGPNRIGQGVEFDYCCVQAAMALREEGCRVIMVNCNPETVSTDYDVSDRLYFEPLTLEDVLHICEAEKPDGVILQFGGQTPLKLALPLLERGIPVWGTSPLDIDRAENRAKFAALVEKLSLRMPPGATAPGAAEAMAVAAALGYPILARPSYVLGGRAMRVIYDANELATYLAGGVELSPANPLLLDKFLEGAVELDVDVVSDGESVMIGGIMEHVEHAGIHSGDSCCVLPPYSLSEDLLAAVRLQSALLAGELKVSGLLNIQFAIQDGRIYVLEANPRASRTVPFVGKVTGVPLARAAALVASGRTLKELGLTRQVAPPYLAVKEAVLPFSRFDKVDIVLGPEMRSTGEVMGIDTTFGAAFAKAMLAAGTPLPTAGTIILTVADRDKPQAVELARELSALGFALAATAGTAAALQAAGIEVKAVQKLNHGSPDIIDCIRKREAVLVINTPGGSGSGPDGALIRRSAVRFGVSIITTMQGARAALAGILHLQKGPLQVRCLQDYYRLLL